VIEAMVAGKPVIVTPVGSLPEIVTDTETGLITADTNPESLAIMIKTLVKNPELAKELALAGHKEVLEKYTLDKWIKETEKVYLETAG
jgi:glycosyltransferase involved in cell wall biosynthesis